MSSLYERIMELRSERHVSIRQMELGSGLSIGSTAKWKDDQFQPSAKSVKKLADYFGVTSDYLLNGSDYRNINDLKRKWSAEQSDTLPGSVRRFQKGLSLPVLGDVPAGIPSEAIEYVDADDVEEISDKMAMSGKYFALKIKGDSMEPRIHDGDVVIVRFQQDVESGDVVIAKIDGEATCKKLIRNDHSVTLVPFNPDYDPITTDNVEICGKVVEVRSKL